MLAHITRVAPGQPGGYMLLDANTQRNLEIFEPLRTGPEARPGPGSLFAVLDQTKTPMGERLLRKWLGQPLLDVAAVRRAAGRRAAVLRLGGTARAGAGGAGQDAGPGAGAGADLDGGAGLAFAGDAAGPGGAAAGAGGGAAAAGAAGRDGGGGGAEGGGAAAVGGAAPVQRGGGADRRGDRRRPGERERDPAGVLGGAGHAADDGAGRAAVPGGAGAPGAGADGDPLAQGGLQPGLRLLHRDLEREPGAGAGRLPAQADAGRGRALHDGRSCGSTSTGCCTPRSWRGSWRRRC